MKIQEIINDIKAVSNGKMSCMFFCKKYDCPELYMNLYSIILDLGEEIVSDLGDMVDEDR